MEYKNFAYSLVATAPSPATSGTSLVVTTGTGTKFPTLNSFYATIWPAGALPSTTNAEIVLVTQISTDTFTIIRAQDGSSARSVVVGDQISATISAASVVRFRHLICNIQTATYLANVLTDDLIVCDKTTAMTINLPPATGSGKIFYIKNINTGTVTVDPDGVEVIGDLTTALVYQWDCIKLCDYDTGKWVII